MFLDFLFTAISYVPQIPPLPRICHLDRYSSHGEPSVKFLFSPF